MAEMAIPGEYLFMFERVLFVLHYFLPYKSISLHFLFACTSLFFYINFQRRNQPCDTDMDYKDIIRKKMNQLVAIVSTEALPSDKQSTEEISAEPVVGDPKVSSATNRYSKKKIIGESVDVKLEVGSSKDSALSKKNSRERTNDRSNGAPSRRLRIRLRRESKKKNIVEEVEASSEDASPYDKGEDHRSVETKIEDDPSNEETTCETGTVDFSTTGSDQLLIASSSKCLEEEMKKWEKEREELLTQLDSTSTILRQTYQSQQQILAQYLQEKKNWEMEKRELTAKLDDSAVTSRLLAFYKKKCLALQIERNGAASYQSSSREKPVLSSETNRFSFWKIHCKAMEDYLIELDDRSTREKRDLRGRIEDYEVRLEQYQKLHAQLGEEKLVAAAAVEMAADSRKRVLELERHCRFCVDPYYNCYDESEYYNW